MNIFIIILVTILCVLVLKTTHKFFSYICYGKDYGEKDKPVIVLNIIQPITVFLDNYVPEWFISFTGALAVLIVSIYNIINYFA